MPERRSKSLGRELERKRVVAFGSTTPRDLSYLTNIPWQYRVYDVKLPNLKALITPSPSQNEAVNGGTARRPPRPYTARTPSQGRSRPMEKRETTKHRPKTADTRKVRIRRSSSTGSIVNEATDQKPPQKANHVPARTTRPPSATKKATEPKPAAERPVRTPKTRTKPVPEKSPKKTREKTSRVAVAAGGAAAAAAATGAAAAAAAKDKPAEPTPPPSEPLLNGAQEFKPSILSGLPDHLPETSATTVADEYIPHPSETAGLTDHLVTAQDIFEAIKSREEMATDQEDIHFGITEPSITPDHFESRITDNQIQTPAATASMVEAIETTAGSLRVDSVAEDAPVPTPEEEKDWHSRQFPGDSQETEVVEAPTRQSDEISEPFERPQSPDHDRDLLAAEERVESGVDSAISPSPHESVHVHDSQSVDGLADIPDSGEIDQVQDQADVIEAEEEAYNEALKQELGIDHVEAAAAAVDAEGIQSPEAENQSFLDKAKDFVEDVVDDVKEAVGLEPAEPEHAVAEAAGVIEQITESAEKIDGAEVAAAPAYSSGYALDASAATVHFEDVAEEVKERFSDGMTTHELEETATSNTFQEQEISQSPTTVEVDEGHHDESFLEKAKHFVEDALDDAKEAVGLEPSEPEQQELDAATPDAESAHREVDHVDPDVPYDVAEVAVVAAEAERIAHEEPPVDEVIVTKAEAVEKRRPTSERGWHASHIDQFVVQEARRNVDVAEADHDIASDDQPVNEPEHHESPLEKVVDAIQDLAEKIGGDEHEHEAEMQHAPHESDEAEGIADAFVAAAEPEVSHEEPGFLERAKNAVEGLAEKITGEEHEQEISAHQVESADEPAHADEFVAGAVDVSAVLADAAEAEGEQDEPGLLDRTKDAIGNLAEKITGDEHHHELSVEHVEYAREPTEQFPAETNITGEGFVQQIQGEDHDIDRHVEHGLMPELTDETRSLVSPNTVALAISGNLSDEGLLSDRSDHSNIHQDVALDVYSAQEVNESPVPSTMTEATELPPSPTESDQSLLSKAKETVESAIEAAIGHDASDDFEAPTPVEEVDGMHETEVQLPVEHEQVRIELQQEEPSIFQKMKDAVDDAKEAIEEKIYGEESTEVVPTLDTPSSTEKQPQLDRILSGGRPEVVISPAPDTEPDSPKESLVEKIQSVQEHIEKVLSGDEDEPDIEAVVGHPEATSEVKAYDAVEAAEMASVAVDSVERFSAIVDDDTHIAPEPVEQTHVDFQEHEPSMFERAKDIAEDLKEQIVGHEEEQVVLEHAAVAEAPVGASDHIGAPVEPEDESLADKAKDLVENIAEKLTGPEEPFTALVDEAQDVPHADEQGHVDVTDHSEEHESVLDKVHHAIDAIHPSDQHDAPIEQQHEDVPQEIEEPGMIAKLSDMACVMKEYVTGEEEDSGAVETAHLEPTAPVSTPEVPGYDHSRDEDHTTAEANESFMERAKEALSDAKEAVFGETEASESTETAQTVPDLKGPPGWYEVEERDLVDSPVVKVPANSTFAVVCDFEEKVLRDSDDPIQLQHDEPSAEMKIPQEEVTTTVEEATEAVSEEPSFLERAAALAEGVKEMVTGDHDEEEVVTMSASHAAPVSDTAEEPAHEVAETIHDVPEDGGSFFDRAKEALSDAKDAVFGDADEEQGTGDAHAQDVGSDSERVIYDIDEETAQSASIAQVAHAGTVESTTDQPEGSTAAGDEIPILSVGGTGFIGHVPEQEVEQALTIASEALRDEAMKETYAPNEPQPIRPLSREAQVVVDAGGWTTEQKPYVEPIHLDISSPSDIVEHLDREHSDVISTPPRASEVSESDPEFSVVAQEGSHGKLGLHSPDGSSSQRSPYSGSDEAPGTNRSLDSPEDIPMISASQNESPQLETPPGREVSDVSRHGVVDNARIDADENGNMDEILQSSTELVRSTHEATKDINSSSTENLYV